MNKAALGFRVKSGWAMAVLLCGDQFSARVADRRRIELADPSVPDSTQPFHAGLDLPRAVAERTIRPLIQCVERVAGRSVADLLKKYRDEHYRVLAAGLAVGSVIDPVTIKNDHIRAHAEEGRLFRSVIVNALKRSRLKATVTPEKELLARGAKVLRLSEARLKAHLAALGKDIEGSWRAEEKAASLAAWIALAEQAE